MTPLDVEELMLFAPLDKMSNAYRATARNGVCVVATPRWECIGGKHM